jgi:raffinose/stachyose/melibiose transport system permease protein
MIFAIWYSLYNWNGYGPLSDFIGLQNYQGVLTGPVFHQALVHNIIIAVLSVVLQLPISIGLALLLNRRMRGQTALRLAVFTPYVLSQATSAVMWSMLLSHGGPADSLLKSAGLAALIHFWLASTSLVLYTLFFVVTWQFIGFGIVLLLAGLQGIPPELREAAAIDGASSWQITRRRSRCRSRSSSCARSCGRSPRNWRTRRPWTVPPGSGSSYGSCSRCPGPPLSPWGCWPSSRTGTHTYCR